MKLNKDFVISQITKKPLIPKIEVDEGVVITNLIHMMQENHLSQEEFNKLPIANVLERLKVMEEDSKEIKKRMEKNKK